MNPSRTRRAHRGPGSFLEEGACPCGGNTLQLTKLGTTAPAAGKDEDFKQSLNPHALEILGQALLEPSLAAAKPGERYQFERKGYYYVDPVDSREGSPVFNRIVPLRDTWAKVREQQG